MDDTPFISSTDGSEIDNSDAEQGLGEADVEAAIEFDRTGVRIRSDSVTSVHTTDKPGGVRYWAPPPFSDASRQIRVLTIEPARNPGDSLSCHLDLTSLDDPCRYLALSYRWGKQPPTFAVKAEDGAIEVSESIIDVGSTLHAALLRIRQHWDKGDLFCGNGRPKLWVDAICVDQQNDTEKSAQVAMMGKIFANAQCVLIWLGEPRAPPPEGRESLLEEELLLVIEAASASSPTITQDITRLRHDPLPELRVLDQLHDTYGLYEDGLRELTARPWFQRRWVVQEILLQPNRYILLGSCCIPFSSFLSSPICIKSLPIDSAADTRQRSRSNSLPKNWSWQPHMLEQRTNLLTCMVVFRHMQCSKLLDRVYALRAISTDGDQFHVDYTKRAYHLYIEFACHYARTTWLPSLLIAATGFRAPSHLQWGSGGREPLPSWVPDWRVSRFKTGFRGFIPESMQAYRSGRRVDTCSFSRLSAPTVEDRPNSLILDCWTVFKCPHAWYEPGCFHCFVDWKAAEPWKIQHEPHYPKARLYCRLDESNVVFALNAVYDGPPAGDSSDECLPAYRLMFFLGIKHVHMHTTALSPHSCLLDFHLETDDFVVTKLQMKRRKIRIV